MNAYTDMLNEWYESAERISHANMPNDGDTIMYPSTSGAYTIEPATFGWAASIIRPADNVRILHRAPKPKPAWHGAVAVMARCSNAPEGHREPFIRSDATPDVWIGEAGYGYTDDLRDVTPLIEAKVTDEMVERAGEVFSLESWIEPLHHEGQDELDAADAADSVKVITAALHAALGIDPA